MKQLKPEKFDKAYSEAKATGFIYPLEKMYVDESTGWELSNDFHNEVEKGVCEFTKNEQQNNILEKMNNYCTALNELAQIGMIRSHHGKIEINTLTNFVNCNISDQVNPYSVDRLIFRKSKVNWFRSNKFNFVPSIALLTPQRPESER